ncbi:MAG: cold shock domain-containing protein [Tannerella sp.]|jgi:cold shock CspA family protein|nr:cold shock domain-containing protein [Tannerella sp.]
MALSFNKRENEKKKQQKRLEKQKRKEEKKISGKSSMDDMIAYVDENGVISSTPPDIQQREKVDPEEILISIPKRDDRNDSEETVIRKGRVDYFNKSKGYGFIKDTDGSDNYFFHISSAPKDITEGSLVTYDLEKGMKGMNAIHITYLDMDK